MTADEKRAERNRNIREMRAQRRANRRCVECDAGLQETDNVKCVECVERARVTARRYVAKNRTRIRAANRDRKRERYAKDPAGSARKQREHILRRKVAGLCIECKNPALEDNIRCAFHREKRNALARNWWRKTSGSKEIRKVMDAVAYRKQERAHMGTRADNRMHEIHAYQPLDAALETPRVKLLRAMRWLDWSQPRDIFDALGLSRHDATAWNTYQASLLRLVKQGLVERRAIGRQVADYRITEAGCIASDALRTGTRVAMRKSA